MENLYSNKSQQNKLIKGNVGPKDTTIDFLLNYSKSLKVVETSNQNSFKFVELVLN